MKKWLQISDWFLQTDDSDVEIHIETEKGEKEFVIPGHGFVLNKASRVFRTMLEPEKFKEGETKVISLKTHGDESDALSFVRYLYTKNLETCDSSSYVALIKTAHLYEVNELHEDGEKSLVKELTPVSVCKIYRALEKVASEDFLTQCKTFMASSASTIFINNLHLLLDQETVYFLVKFGTFLADDEEKLLDALWYWIHVKCLLEDKNQKLESRKIMTSFVQTRGWSNNVDDLGKGKPWHDLIKEFGKTVERTELVMPTFGTFGNKLTF